VVYNAEVYRTWMRLNPDDVILAGAPLFHITGLIAHLAVGALGLPMILSYRFDPAELLSRQAQFGGSFSVMAITAYIALLHHPALATSDLTTFTKAYSGGAPIPPAVVEAFVDKTGVRIHPVYGLTETTSPSHAVPLGVNPPIDPALGALSIGVPLPDVECRVVDLVTGEDASIGEQGELWIRSPGVVKGYWRNPSETALALAGGWLRTGDICSMDADGWFYIVDRAKDMIIASGFKIWPREVEEVLFSHPSVREAAVIGIPDSYRGQTVKAFVALSDQAATLGELESFCRDHIAAYKVPRQIEIVDEIPKTASGKFSRRALRLGQT
ncbi:MAG: class I adenylate-forming enzyme family protein, partial [Chloroflexota bacterium]